MKQTKFPNNVHFTTLAEETLKEVFGQVLPKFAKETTKGVADVIKTGVKRKVKEAWEDAVPQKRAKQQASEEAESDFEESKDVIKTGVKRKVKEAWEDAVPQKRAKQQASEEAESDFEESKEEGGTN